MTPESAFAPACSRQAYLETSAAADAMRRLEAGFGAREPILLLTGEHGSGKTALVNEALARWGDAVVAARVAYTPLAGAELLEEIVLRLGGKPAEGASRPRLLACLEGVLGELTAAGRMALVVVDDAHALAPQSLDELGLLANTARQSGHALEVLLTGLPALAARLDEPGHAALRQRVALRLVLGPLAEDETRLYVRHRLEAVGADGTALFPRKTCAAVAAFSQGLPRRINSLAAEALREAKAALESAVSPAHVRTAAIALWGEGAMRSGVPAASETEAGGQGSAEGKFAPAPAPVAQPAPRVLRGAAPARETATQPAARPEEQPTSRLTPAATASPQPAPRVAPAPAPPRPRAPIEPEPESMPPKPIRHDPGEWVARFVGDRGPVRIGSQAGVAAIFDPDPQDFANPGSESAAARRAALAAAPPARPRKSRALGVAVFGLVAAAAVVAVAIVIVRGAHPGGPQGVQTAVATTHVAAPPRAATSSSAPVVRQAATPEKPGVEATPGAEQAISSKSGRYSIEVGSFATLEAAIAERDRASQATGIQGWVVPAPEGSSEQHRVILGIYRSKERAAAAAKMVVATRTLPHAVAVALPPKHARL